jgi:dimethylaniline monooxygenase (N-oxide forming)
MVQPLGSIMPIAEMQSRIISRILSELYIPPSPEIMKKEIIKERKIREEKFNISPRHTLEIEYLEYMDKLASLIDIKPKLYKYPNLILPLLFGPLNSAQYRLDGPKSKNKLSQEILINIYNSKPDYSNYHDLNDLKFN